jgi:hypothetical protein
MKQEILAEELVLPPGRDAFHRVPDFPASRDCPQIAGYSSLAVPGQGFRV